jgi:hypothetical protein
MMEDDEEIDEGIIKRIDAYLEREEQGVNQALCILYGEMPRWIPSPSIERARRTVKKLINDGFSAAGIQQSIAEAERGELIFPGIVTDPGAFAQSVYELAHLRYAISQRKSKGLLILAGEQAEHGQRFKDGRKPGSSGPVRKAIAKFLAKNQAMKNPELWEAIKNKPPKGWQAYENARFGKYFEGPAGAKMEYGRFCTVCGEERKKVKRKITG